MKKIMAGLGSIWRLLAMKAAAIGLAVKEFLVDKTPQTISTSDFLHDANANSIAMDKAPQLSLKFMF